MTPRTSPDSLADDELLGPVVSAYGPKRLEPAPDFFARFVRSIVSQQISTAAAASIHDQLSNTVELSPTAVYATEIESLTAAGLSSQKAATIRRVARRFMDTEWETHRFEGRSNADVRATLTEINGVGPWTADMQLIFSLARPDVFPVGDLGIRTAMRQLVDADLTRGEMRSVAERWEPHRSLASMYLWELVD